MTAPTRPGRGDAPSSPYVSDWKVLRAMTRSLPRGVLSRPAREMYLHLAGHVGADGLCCVSMETLVKEMDCHIRTVRKARAELERADLIVTTPGGGDRTNLYWFVDVRHPQPRANQPGVPRANRAATPGQIAPGPRANRPGEEEIEEEVEESACACGNPLITGRWRCGACQERVDMHGAAVAIMLGMARREAAE